MLTQLPSEIIYHIFEYLPFEDVRSTACVCSAFRLPSQLRLFRTIHIRARSLDGSPNHTQSILSSPHLLQYPSTLIVRDIRSRKKGSFWSHLPMMYRLSYVEIILDSHERLRALSALESCGSARGIALRLARTFHSDTPISDNPLPVHTLDLRLDDPGYQLAARVVQKCSQSLRQLDLFISDGIKPTLPFLPYLNELSLYMMSGNRDLMSWFPFLDRHPTITRLSLCTRFTLTVQPSPDLLPDLQSLKATPAVIEQLAPGRPVSCIHISYPSRIAPAFPLHVNAMLRSLQQPIVPMTSLEIITDTFIPSDGLIFIVQALPKLRKFILDEPHYEVCFALQDLLTALGKCENMDYIRMNLVANDAPYLDGKSLFSRRDFVQMLQRVQEKGAANLWSFQIGIKVRGVREICEAFRVGWLDVPSQPTLKGEWQFDIRGVMQSGSSEDFDMPTPAPNASVDSQIGG